MSQPSQTEHYAGEIKRGALFNFLGGVAKLAQPLSILCVTWLWGPSFTGAYLLGQSLLEIVSACLCSGCSDATTIFGSRHAELAAHDEREERALYRVFANMFAVTGGASLLLALAALLCAAPLVHHVFPHYAELLPGLYWLAFSLVPRSLGLVAIAATKAMMRMEHDAWVQGVVFPISLLVAYLVVFAAGGGLLALCAAQLVVELLTCALAFSAFRRYFSLARVGSALRDGEWDRRLLGFALPQSLNLTFNRYIARVDAIMLASFGLAEADLAYFATAAYLTSNLGQIRTLFSGALAPALARLHVRNERAAFEETLGRVSRWTTAIVVPVVLVLVVLREDVLRSISGSYGGHSAFVVVLLIPPLTNCAFGMAGACLMFTGHSRMTLANSLCVALLNTAFTYLLIPRYGMLGAAIATTIATSITTGLQMLELWWLERFRIRLSAVWKPHLGFLLGAVVLGALWDPAQLSAPLRFGVALAIALGYLALMFALRLEELTPARSTAALD